MNAHPETPVAPVMTERRVSLLGAALVALGPLSLGLFTPSMPELVTIFGTSESAIKLTLSLYFAGFAIAQLVCGPLSDGYGRKPVTFAFIGIYLAGSLVALFAPTIEVLLAARFVQGVGAAVGVSVSRAMVRDLFTSERSARIMNLIGLILGIAPAVAPTLGGLAFEFAGWHAAFVMMIVAGAAILVCVHVWMVETVVRDTSRIKPRALLSSYGTLARHREFMLNSLVMGGSVGGIYAFSTVVPFVLMGPVGLTPSQFGIGMLAQSGAYIGGSFLFRALMRRFSAFDLVLPGVLMLAVGSVGLAVGLRVFDTSYIVVMIPCAIFTCGVAFVLPAISTAALAPFPRIAGAAAALGGFFQMGGGLAGGTVAALMGDPVLALATVIPAMGAVAILAWFLWRIGPKTAAV